MNLVYEEVEIAIQEENPPFAAIITDSENNNILAVAHNQANTQQLAIAHTDWFNPKMSRTRHFLMILPLPFF